MILSLKFYTSYCVYFYQLDTRYMLRVTLVLFCLVTMITDCTGVLISPWPDLEGNKLMFLSEWREFPSAPYLAEKNMMTSRVSMLLKSRASLTCFRACFLPGRDKDLSAPQYMFKRTNYETTHSLRCIRFSLATSSLTNPTVFLSPVFLGHP